MIYLFHKGWASTQIFIYMKGHTVFVFNVKATGSWSLSRIFTIWYRPIFQSVFLIFHWGQAELFVIPGPPTSLISLLLVLPAEKVFLSSLPVSNLLYILGPAQSQCVYRASPTPYPLLLGIHVLNSEYVRHSSWQSPKIPSTYMKRH